MRSYAEEGLNAAKRVGSDGQAFADPDQVLVMRARQGDTEALGELLEQHRHQAYAWAERLTQDPHMADDVVQDALMRTFMHIGTLSDHGRFLPWFYRIVSNQANMKLRRGGPYRKERPFASMVAPSAHDGSLVDWGDLDSVLFHLAKNATDAAEKEQNPADHLARKEIYEWIRSLLHCLSRKERDIFEAYFFSQLSPDEMSRMFSMTTGSIYTYIHRCRRKLRKEHLRISTNHMPEEGGNEIVVRKVLPLPAAQANAPVHTTFVASIGRILEALGDARESAALMGLSTIAFRIKLSDATTFADGLYVFDWRDELHKLMDDLGYEVTLLCGQLADTPVPLLRAVERFPITLRIEEAVIPFIRRHIDNGTPLLYFDTQVSKPYVHEWAVIYGYDDKAGVVHLTDPGQPEGKIVSYADIIHNPIRFLAGFSRKQDHASSADTAGSSGHTRIEQALRTIRFVTDYARRGCDFLPHASYTSGLAAYDRWIAHLRNPYSEPNRYGMGQLCAVLAEARRFAALYLRSLPLEEEPLRLSQLASEAYGQCAEVLEQLSRLVPFMKTSESLLPDTIDICATLLSEAKVYESAAIGYLEQLIAIKKIQGEEISQ